MVIAATIILGLLFIIGIGLGREYRSDNFWNPEGTRQILARNVGILLGASTTCQYTPKKSEVLAAARLVLGDDISLVYDYEDAFRRSPPWTVTAEWCDEIRGRNASNIMPPPA